ncbi:hypothetical protein EXIGLDRAFT_724954 [Exidia glandulosa HHB12029]|uniref:Uncharacterized protein n=1 Tax=Exidia glandulosa HHB12029 TaxID=1314781 RepID=A0A165MMB2_EXIGL|nr:hypothetical protein EXIGLDRAFT_724954 [Exidia glandulosa HHB12029]
MTVPAVGQTCPALAHVVSLDYDPSIKTLSRNEFEHLFTLMPQLHTFKVVFDELDGATSPTPSFPLGQLQNITVTSAYDATVVLDAFQGVRYGDFHLGLVNQVADHPRLQHLVRIDTFMGGIYSYFCDGPNTIRLYRSVGVYSKVNPLRLPTLETLTTLNIVEWEWCRYPCLPRMPALHSLTICLASCAEYHATLFPHVGHALTSVWEADVTRAGVECPELYALHLVSLQNGHCVAPYPVDDESFACCCGNGCTLSLHDVERFIRTAFRLNIEQQRLPSLVLSGIRSIIDVDLSAAFTSLSEVVETIDFGETIPINLRDVDEWRIRDSAGASWDNPAA